MTGTIWGCFIDVETRYRRSNMRLENAYHVEAEYRFWQQGLPRGVLSGRGLCCLELEKRGESSEGGAPLNEDLIGCLAPGAGGICIRGSLELPHTTHR